MDPGAYTIVGSALLQQRRLEILANNLAQANTVGYKTEIPTFKTVKNTLSLEEFPRLEDVAEQMEWRGTHIDFRQGFVKKTGNNLDVALNGPGFFVVRAPEGERYTRAGDFTLDKDGQIVTKEGWLVLGTGGEGIRIQTSALAQGGIIINSDGEVRVGGQLSGKFNVVDFAKPYRLERRGSSTYVPIDPEAQPQAVESPQITQRSLEVSNVSAITEMVNLIEVARLYEIYQKILQSFDEVDAIAINEIV